MKLALFKEINKVYRTLSVQLGAAASPLLHLPSGQAALSSAKQLLYILVARRDQKGVCEEVATTPFLWRF